jgi:hypothetical protein
VECKTGRRARIASDDTRAIVQAQKITGGGQMVEGGKLTSGKKEMRKTLRTVAALTLRWPHSRERQLRSDHCAGGLQRMTVCLQVVAPQCQWGITS